MGCDDEGHLLAVRARMVGDTGAYASVGDKVLERAAGHACSAYRVPNVDVEARAVYTNNPPCRRDAGLRGEPGELRHRGDHGPPRRDRSGSTGGRSGGGTRSTSATSFGTGQVLGPGVGVSKTLQAVRGTPTRSARYAGIACGVKNTGVGNGLAEFGKAVLRPEADGTVTLFHSWTEMGQGCHTALAQIACEELGLDADAVRVVVDTERELGHGPDHGVTVDGARRPGDHRGGREAPRRAER